MDSITRRDTIPFPLGDNKTDTKISGYHLNLDTLQAYNYKLYENRTLSNDSWCVLAFEPWAPTYLFPNGTFQNVTWCYRPLNPIGPRGKTSIGLAVAFSICLLLAMVNLRKHGRLYLQPQQRFRPIGRRWQWYWSFFVCVAALISLFTNVDVDRYYIMELPIVLTNFFWFLMQQGTMAMVWEAARHWASWNERKLIDPDPFMLREDDRRAKFEFWMPLWFYLWLWMNFFLIVPRNWQNLEFQRSPAQTETRAKPTATDNRFKAAAFVLVVCWLTILIHMEHSIKHYKLRSRGSIRRAVGFIRHLPPRFALMIPLTLILIGYQSLAAFVFDLSVLNVQGSLPAIFAGGYTPTLLILLTQCIWGFISPNEDLELLRRRRERGQVIDQELGIVHKPPWWRRVQTDDHLITTVRDRIERNVRQIGGRPRPEHDALEGRRDGITKPPPNGPVPGGRDAHGPESGPARSNLPRQPPAAVCRDMSEWPQSRRTEPSNSGLLLPRTTHIAPDPGSHAAVSEPPPPYAESLPAAVSERVSADRGRSAISTAPSTAGQPQRVRSMLDV